MSNNKPVHEIRLGRIRASLWQNAVGNGPAFSVTFSRLYKDETDGKWSSSDSFSRDDLLVLRKVADLAHTYISEQPTRASEQEA
jgi:hypothetical protein